MISVDRVMVFIIIYNIIGFMKDQQNWDSLNTFSQRDAAMIQDCLSMTTYRQPSNISRTQSLNINVSRLVLKSYLPNPLNPGVKLRTKM